MTMQRWQPYRDMINLRNAMDRLLEDSFVRPTRRMMEVADQETLPVDMYQTENDVVIKASLPGYKPDEVEISVSGDTLTIRGEHQEEKETSEKDYFFKERSYGSFSRTVTFPVPVKSEMTEATFENGELTLKLPKVEEAKPKQIKIKAKPQITSGKKS